MLCVANLPGLRFMIRRPEFLRLLLSRAIMCLNESTEPDGVRMAKKIQLTAAESKLLKYFRSLPTEQQQVLLRTATGLVAATAPQKMGTAPSQEDDFGHLAERCLHQTLVSFPPKTTEVNLSRVAIVDACPEK